LAAVALVAVAIRSPAVARTNSSFRTIDLPVEDLSPDST
jgi:hypothetical protein